MDKPPKKDKPASDANPKTKSVLDNILGDDLGFGMDDFSLDLGMNLDSILNKEIGSLSKSGTKGAFDDIISPDKGTPATPTPPKEEPTPPETPAATETPTPPETEVASTSTTPAPAPEVEEAVPAAQPEAPDAQPEAPDAQPEAPAAPAPSEVAQAPTESAESTPTESAPPADEQVQETVTSAIVPDASSSDASAETVDAADNTVAPTPEAPTPALTTDAPSEAKADAPTESTAAPSEAKVDVADASTDAAQDVDLSIAGPQATIEPTAEASTESPQKEALVDAVQPQPSAAIRSIDLSIASSSPKVHETTMELEEADEVLEELRALHQRTLEKTSGAMPPPPPPPRPGPQTPPPPPKTDPPPPPSASKSTPPPPPDGYLRGPDERAPSALELDLGDAIVEIAPGTDEDAIPRIKAQALASAPIDVPKDVPEAPLQPPPSDLKELLDVPSPHMPQPPETIDHEVSFPKAPLQPPPGDLKQLIDGPTPHLEPPPKDLKPRGDLPSPTEAAPKETSDSPKHEATGSLFPGVDPSVPAAAPQALPQPTPQAKAESRDQIEALADAFSNSATELAAIQQPSPTPSPTSTVEPPKRTQLLGPDFAASLQQELHKMSPPADGTTKESTPESTSPITAAPDDIFFPPSAPAPATSGTADFLDNPENASASATSTPAPPKKPVNPMMQTAMYGPEVAAMQQQLLGVEQAKEATNGAAATPDTAAIKQKDATFQTQLYTADDVSKAAAKITNQQDTKATIVEMEKAPAPQELEKPGVKVQLEPNQQSFQSDLPADSLFDVNMDAEIEERVAAKKQEEEAERAIQAKNFSAAIQIYHQLQQKYPKESHYQEQLKQLVALDKQAKAAPSPGPAPLAQPRVSSQSKAANAQGRPSIQSARKAPPPKQGLSTLNMILAGLVILLSITLLTGLVWPGWLRSKPKPKPSTIAPLIPAGDAPAKRKP